MNETIVTLKKGEGRAFKAGGLWIYDNEIESIHGTFKNGAVVTVQEQNGCPARPRLHQPELQNPHPHAHPRRVTGD